MEGPDPDREPTPGELTQLRLELLSARDRLRALTSEVSTLRAGLASIRADLERIGRSRSWRWGHGVAQAIARATGRRVLTEGAVASALERLDRLEEAVGVPPQTATAPLTVLPPGHAERVPQTADPARLASEIRRRRSDPEPLTDQPLVSAVVVTRNGLPLMKRLVDGLNRRTAYSELELVVVDNDSTDGTREWLPTANLRFPLIVHANRDNQPFGQACNAGAALANGELLLFLNNDVEPVDGVWLRELVLALGDGVAAAGARLLHAGVTHPEAPSGWIVQHCGIRFARAGHQLHARNAGDGEDAFGEGFGVNALYPGATAACLLVRAEAFHGVGGFSPGYRWGTEDVDLGLKLLGAGHDVCGSGRAVLLHRESSTQDAAGREFMRLNRLGNRTLFEHRWASSLRRDVRLDRLARRRFFSAEPPGIAIAVSSSDPGDGWGDWYTAQEIGEALTEVGWRVSYTERKGGRWYDLDDEVDYVLVLLDAFDARNVDPSIVTIAWIRNWTERWLSQPWFDRLDVLLCSSKTSAELVREATGREAALFPLATNPTRFSPQPTDAARDIDYVFTGNSWGVEREVERALRPRAGEQVAVYGSGWEEVEAFAPHLRGPVSYRDLPRIYSGAKVVVDDAARHTEPYGAVNSRVFDALACGTPVVTNGASGVRELFDEDFPVWDSKATLRDQLDRLLDDPERRASIAKRYGEEVLLNHTYSHRAHQLTELLEEFEERLSFCIKIGAPSWEAATAWGDLYFAKALASELQRRGHRSLIQVLPEWEDSAGHEQDVTIVLRGLSRYPPKQGQFNVLWCISHPDKLSGTECDGYDLVCVASPAFAADVAERTAAPVIVLEQATDPRVFRPEPGTEYAHELVFVGNSRNVRRRILDDLLPTSHELAVYGSGWEELIDRRCIAGQHVPNQELRRVYSSGAIVLNDHWDDMRTQGFLSNRLYDAVACGAFVISDRVDGVEEQFGGAVVTYESREELHDLVERFLADPAERAARGEAGRREVLAHHTFAHRVDVLLGSVAERMAATGHRTRITGNAAIPKLS